MQQLAQREIDYRIIYISEREFAERVQDVYISKQTAKRPPFFNEVLEELIDIEAIFFIKQHREEFSDLSDKQVEDLIERVSLEDVEAIQMVLERIQPQFVELFARDLYLHLVVNQFTFYEKDFYQNCFTREHNSPLLNVW